MKRLFLISMIFLAANAYSQLDSLDTQPNSTIHKIQLDSLDIQPNLTKPMRQLNSVDTQTSSYKHKKQDDWKAIGLYAASIILNGIGDGLNNRNLKTAGHAINALSIGVLVASPFLIDYNKKKWYWYLAAYTSLRIGLFDSTYNLTQELPLGYVGTTSPTDIFYNFLGLDPNIPRPLFLGIGIVIPITKL
jgi:hypothetical protein